MESVRTSIQGTSARYDPLFKLASGGMATVYVGRLVGALGFQRLVAIKRPHRHLFEDPRFVKMLLAEATLASKLQHPNVVSVQDVVLVDGVVYLVMDLVEGGSLADLIRASSKRGEPIPPAIAIRMLLDTCAGLHAAHELTDDSGKQLGLVHRDVSPHNVLVSVDGVARVMDFGIAKCMNVEGPSTTTGMLKGKYAYMAPETIKGQTIDRRADVFSLGVVAWELFSGRRLFLGESPANTMLNVIHERAPLLSEVTDLFGKGLDDAVEQALAKEPDERFMSVEAFAAALEGSARTSSGVAPASQVAKFVRALVGDVVDLRRKQVRTLLREQEREPQAQDSERPTQPLPEGYTLTEEPLSTSATSGEAQLDGAVGPASIEPTPAPLPESSRDALVPSGEHGPTQMAAITNYELPTKRHGWVWTAFAVGALGAVGVFAFRHVVLSREVPSPASSVGAELEPLSSAIEEAKPTPSSVVPEPIEAGAAEGGVDPTASTLAPRPPTTAPKTHRPPESTSDAVSHPPQPKTSQPYVPPPNPYSSGAPAP